MKIHISREALSEGINIVQKAVAARTASPILECILLCAETKHITLTANNLELGIESAPMEAVVEAPGLLALNARLFSEIIKKVQGETVTIENDEKFVTKITCGSSEFKIMGYDGATFPGLPEIEKQNPYILDQNVFRNMIRQTIFSISQDEIKPVLTGELLEIGENKLNLVSVDGYRISYREASMTTGESALSAIVPGKALLELSRLLSNEDGESLSVYFTERHVLFDFGNAILVSRLIEGDYIKYRQSFGTDFSTILIADRNDLIQAIERATIISMDMRKNPVKLKMENNRLFITSNTEIGTTYEEMQVELDGSDLVISFNPRYLLEALKAIDDERVKLQFSTALSPLVITSIEAGSSYLYLILPLRT